MRCGFLMETKRYNIETVKNALVCDVDRFRFLHIRGELPSFNVNEP